MTDLAVFSYADTQIRTTIRDGAPWFVAKDVCDVLGLVNPSKAVQSLDEDEFVLVEGTLTSREGSHAPTINLVNEPGLYSLILRSRKPEAKAFKRWITHEVLPVLRRTGRYSTTQPVHASSPVLDVPIRERAAASARCDLSVIHAMGDNVTAAAKEAMVQLIWIAYARTVGLDIPPQTPTGLRNAAAVDHDEVAQWLADSCEPYGPGTQAAALYASFTNWCRANDIEQPTVTMVGRRLTALGYPARRGDKGCRYRPLRAR